MLGLPWGVDTGVMKLFMVGVPGRSVAEELTSLLFCVEGNILDMKLAMATDANEAIPLEG